MFGQGVGAAASDNSFEAAGATTAGLATLERRAGWSIVLVALAGCLGAGTSLLGLVSDADPADETSLGPALLALAYLIVLFASAVAFFRWLHRAVVCAHALVPEEVRPTFQPPEAVYAFFIPVYNLWGPYQRLSELSNAIAPHMLPEPQPLSEPAPTGEYRSPGRRLLPTPAPTAWPETAPVLAWWLAWMATNILGNIVSRSEPNAPAGLLVADALANAASAVLAILMIRSISLRLRETARRRSVPLPTAPFYG